MSLPSGYSYDDSGHIYKDDGTGPYSISSGGVATLLSGSEISADTAGFTQGPNGFYYYIDGSGPYVKTDSGMYTLL